MATENLGKVISLEAAASFASKQYYFAKVDSSGKAALASAAGEVVIGVIQNNPLAGAAAAVCIDGVSKVLLGGNVTAGALVGTDATGKAVTATKGRTDTSDAGAAVDPLLGSYIVGVAKTGGSTGEYIEVILSHVGVVATTAI